MAMIKILITSGGTREAIDEVRFISNVSTGGTGAALANAFAARGHQVTLLRGQASVAPDATCQCEFFSSAEDLQARLKRQLSETCYDAVLMCAAVADYRPDALVSGKIRSDANELILRLVRTPKILPQIKGWRTPAPLVIGFKLTVSASAAQQEAAVNAQFASGGVDAVVQNDLTEINKAQVHPFNLYRAPGRSERLYGSSNLAQTLAALIEVGGARS